MSQKQYKGYVTSAGRQYVPEVNVVPIRRDAQARPFTQTLSGLQDAIAHSFNQDHASLYEAIVRS